jgi:hypothetical protein
LFISARIIYAILNTASAKKSASASSSFAKSRILFAAPRADFVDPCGTGPVYRLSAQLLPGVHCYGQVNRRGQATSPQELHPLPRLRTDGPNQVWSWYITYLPTILRGVWLYRYLVIDVLSRKLVA